MKMHLFIKAAFFLSVAACNTNTNSQVNNDSVQATDIVAPTISTQDTFITGKIITPVICKADAGQSYAAYVPSSAKKSLPIIFCFDPHADGALPLKNYKLLADKYGFILIGSNNSKNGNDGATTQNIWNTLYTDVRQRINFDNNRVYVCGFSGGAKVASQIALQNNFIKGVIAGGATLPDGVNPSNYNFSFTGIAGKGDMNMTDIVSTDNAFDQTTTKHRIILFDGKHAWAPETVMNIAFEGLEFDAMRNFFVAKNESLIDTYIDQTKKKITALKSSNKLIDANDECKLSINLLDGLTNETGWFKNEQNEIQTNNAFKNQLQQQENLFATEQSIKATYNQQFQNGDINYWNKTITDLKFKSKAVTAEGAMYQRLLAYLSLAFYSISNQLINQNNNDAAKYFVDLYKMADSTNSEAWYFSAILNARAKNFQQTKNDLIKSVQLGFNDKVRMQSQPEFQSIATQIDLSSIESQLH